MNIPEKDSHIVWNEFYKNNKKELKYPDENLVRIIENVLVQNQKNINQWKFALDFGCGTGRHLWYLKEKGISHLYGMDYAKEVIQWNQKYIPFAKFIYYQNGNRFPFPDSFFDLIICWGVLHYNSEEIRDLLLKEFHRILKKNGYLIGTYRAHTDTHFHFSSVGECKIFFFRPAEIQKELGKYFREIQIGYTERTPLGNLNQKIAHYFFSVRN